MQPPGNRLALTDPKLWLLIAPKARTGRAISALDFHDQSYAKWSQGTAVEVTTHGVVACPKIDVV
jgi:hypothetical protein